MIRYSHSKRGPKGTLNAKQGQVGQEGAPCGLSNECVTDQPTDQQTDTASYRGALAYLKRVEKQRKKEQGRIHGYLSRVRVGRHEIAQPSSWAGAVTQKPPVNADR